MKTLIPLLAFLPLPALADFPVVEAATATQNGASWTISVTLSHPDSGWEHYADGWEVLAPDGTRLGYRLLSHPHVTEQPFTRRLGAVVIPEGTGSVRIRAHCGTDGWSDQTFKLDIGG